jgi:ribosomal protein L40E
MKTGVCARCAARQPLRWSAALRAWLCGRCGGLDVRDIRPEKPYNTGR